MDELTVKWTDRPSNGPTNSEKDCQTDQTTVKQTDRQSNRMSNGPTDRQMDLQMNRPNIERSD